MRLLFRDHLPADAVERAIANTVLIADWVEDYQLLTDQMQEPEFEVPPGYDTQDDYLKFLGVTGLHRTFPDGIPAGYEERLNIELSVIAEKGFSGYMLIVWDIVKWAREQNIPVGMGRGSVGGSLLAWVIGITGFDPIKYNCLFERFINPKRKSYPDIDLDFCVKRRQEVLNYIVQKYGSDRVCLIGTISRLKSKNAIQDVGRILGIPPWERDKIAEMVPSSRGNTPTLKKILEKPETAPNLHKLYRANPRVKQWIDMARMVEGSARNAGVHAAGVLISAVPLDDLIPVYSTDVGEIVSQYPKDDVEAIGGLKVDVLGVAELSTIRLSQELIFQNHGVWIDVDNLDPTDTKTFELFKRGETEGVFQFESDGMRGLLTAIAPESLEDLAAITSLYRPGPLDTGMVEMYVKCKNNQSAIFYKYPILEEVLGVTYSTIIFQEQVMKLCQVVAGYDLGQADLVRRAMGKKKPEEMAKHQEGFIKGAIANNFDAEWAANLWNDLEKYAEYCFNVPHAIAYSFTSYQTAYLKTYYPVEYLAAILTEKIGKKEDIAKYVAMARRMGIPILPPNINRSDDVFKPEGNAVRFGLGAISHVGAAAPTIVKARNQSGDYTSLEDFCGSLLPNKGVLNALIHAGAFDCLNPNRHRLAKSIEAIADWIKDESKRLKSQTPKQPEPQEVEGQLALFSPEPFKKPRAKKASVPKKFPELVEAADYLIKERIGLEKNFLGFYLSGHPLDDLVDIKKLVSPLPFNQIASCRDGQIICCMGFVSRAKEIRTKKRNALMSFLTLDDQSGQVEAIAFSDFYESNADLLQEGARLVVTGKVQHKDGKSQIVLDFAKDVDSTFTCLLINLSLMQAQERLSLLKIQNTLSSAKRKSRPCPVIATIPGASRGVVLNPRYWVENPELATRVLSDRGFNASLLSYELGNGRKALTPSMEVSVASAA
jgi:DNA polymerase-3 subunit alpha